MSWNSTSSATSVRSVRLPDRLSKGRFRRHYVDGFATLDTSDRQGRIAGYEEAVGVMLFRTMT
jgi:hypothetical protein